MNVLHRNHLLFLTVILSVTMISFYPSLHNGWTTWDDNVYVSDNPVIQQLNFAGITEIFTKIYHGTYLPMTMLSYMIDYRIGEFQPIVYHTTNLILHLMNSCLVYWLMVRLTGNPIAALIVGLLFGIHPMRVESVAWISGRKDLLAMLFFLLSSLTYLRHVKERRWYWLWITFVLYLFAILSKIIVLTFPLLLLLLDWMLKRTPSREIIIEKIPFLLVSLALSVIGLMGQESIHAIRKSQNIFENAVVSLHGIMFYIQKLFWPVDLSHVYPYPETITFQYYLFAVLFVVVSLLVYRSRHNRSLVFGYLFFIISLLPVLQFLRFSQIFAADRFTYFAYIGPFFIIGMYSAELWQKMNRKLLFIAATLIVGGFSIATWQRCEVWKDSTTLWQDMLSKYPYDGVYR